MRPLSAPRSIATDFAMGSLPSRSPPRGARLPGDCCGAVRSARHESGARGVAHELGSLRRRFQRSADRCSVLDLARRTAAVGRCTPAATRGQAGGREPRQALSSPRALSRDAEQEPARSLRSCTASCAPSAASTRSRSLCTNGCRWRATSGTRARGGSACGSSSADPATASRSWQLFDHGAYDRGAHTFLAHRVDGRQREIPGT